MIKLEKRMSTGSNCQILKMNGNYSDITEQSISGNMRIVADRRKCPTPIISRYTFYRGRRKKARRQEDKRNHVFVDIYSSRLLIAVLLLLSLSCLDAFLTLELMSKGIVYEANPIMAFFLDYGILQFSLIKFFLTATSLIVLCLFKNCNIARIGLPVAMCIYFIVVAYEIYLYTV